MTDKKYKNILREILEEKIPNTKRRDFLIQNEIEVQKRWNDEKAFEFNKPEDISKPKFMATFPYPYMNGRLHLGHVFTISKAAFAVFYERLKGKHALFPFAFHCTGMPIKACADRLKRELEIYGAGGPPPPSEEELERQRNEIKETLKAELEGKKAPVPKKEVAKAVPKEDPSAHHSNKSKAVAKGSDAKTQWDIMRSLGLTDDEIVLFTDPVHWLHYFPPHCKEDLIRFGAGVDWRRSFITTDVNPFYDSFVRWQFETLRDLNKIKFGKRYSIYSPLDGQPCLDHDRSSGENVLPQEYTLIKMKVLSKIPNFDYRLLKNLKNNINDANDQSEVKMSENEEGDVEDIEGYKIYLVPATLRPETMYGQTNCWIKPDAVYGAFLINDTDVFICSDRSARNMAYQELSPEYGKVIKITEINGTDLIGAKLRAPLSHYPVVYTLPMMTITLNKGTGIVTSVPSDSPDDFAALRDLKSKPALREKFNVKDEWVLPYEEVPIIHTSLGDLIAPILVEKLKIKSQNDEKLLAEAKEQSYTLGYYEGVLLVGKYKGEKVEIVKDKIRGELFADKLAVNYSEPEKPVVSRSGDNCVVALVDQWFLVYGEENWKQQALSALKGMNTYHDETRHMFEKTLGWLNQWACSRSFGLGTKFPWDDQYLIESLSDSTIYMGYYTIAHLIQNDINGKENGILGISPNQFTREVWDYLFLGKEFIPDKMGGIEEEKLKKLRGEFEYWYPLDLRVSGKDLVPNHLTFAIYNHCAIFPPEKWIKGIRANGHLLLNNLKMSKNTGNFLTLYDSIDLFGADATRFALADAGDTLEDANFSSNAANKAVLTLFNSIQWAAETLQKIDQLNDREIEDSIADRTFDSLINFYIVSADQAFAKLNYRDALLNAFFELRNARDDYRNRVGPENMNRKLVLKFIEVQAVLMTPITPHWSEKIWDLLHNGKKGMIVHAEWPTAGFIDENLLTLNQNLKDMIEEFRKKIQSSKVKITNAIISVAKTYPAWYLTTVDLLHALFSEGNLSVETAAEKIKKDPSLRKVANIAMPRSRDIIEKVKEQGEKAFDVTLPYDEQQLLLDNLSYLEKTLEVKLTIAEEAKPGEGKNSATPLHPTISFPKQQ